MLTPHSSKRNNAQTYLRIPSPLSLTKKQIRDVSQFPFLDYSAPSRVRTVPPQLRLKKKSSRKRQRQTANLESRAEKIIGFENALF